MSVPSVYKCIKTSMVHGQICEIYSVACDEYCQTCVAGSTHRKDEAFVCPVCGVPVHGDGMVISGCAHCKSWLFRCRPWGGFRAIHVPVADIKVEEDSV